MSDREFTNVYSNRDYAASYAALEWGGTYYLIYRDLPWIIARHVVGRRALDFGCGTGRSTRLLHSYGFQVTGIDIAESMICIARKFDPDGDYRTCTPGELSDRPPNGFDLILAAFPFDNIPGDQKKSLFLALRDLLAPSGHVVNIVSSPGIYLHEWASFSTKRFQENRDARSDDIVRIITREFTTQRPAEDILCTPEAYRAIYDACGLEIVAEERPLGRETDGVDWLSETNIAPWTIYVLAKKEP